MRQKRNVQKLAARIAFIVLVVLAALPARFNAESIPLETVNTGDQIRLDLSKLTLEQKINQMFVLLPEQLTGYGSVTQAGDATQMAIADHPVGGLIYMGNNILSEEQTAQMIANTQSYSRNACGLPMLICVDEEGGTVSRISGRGFADVPYIPDMWSIGAEGNTEQAEEIGKEVGSYLQRFGFNVNFAPVCDVVGDPADSAIGTRSFGNDPEAAGRMVSAYISGLAGSGVIPVLKHFPGHGAAAADSHAGYAISQKNIDELKENDLIPFQTGIDAGAEMVMVGHLSFPSILGDNTPASLSSYFVTELLRKEMGFDGVVITDALNMGAVANYYDSGSAAVMAVQAGVDILLVPADFAAAYQGLLYAVESGVISEERIDESVGRILALKRLTGDNRLNRTR